jgi:hypothetical protein
LLNSQESFARDVPKPKRRLIKEVLSGIKATKDVKLSNISRSLNEQRSLIKTEDRISRILSDVGFTDGMNHQMGRFSACRKIFRGMLATEPEVGAPGGADIIGFREVFRSSFSLQ